MEKEVKNSNEKHRKIKNLYRKLKIAAFCVLGAGIILIVLGAVFIAKSIIPAGIPCLVIGFISMGISLMLLMTGFIPNFSNYTIKSTQYIQDINKEELEEMMSTRAEITKEGASVLFDAFNESANKAKEQRKKVYCKHCGQQIDEDSRFCKFCGKEQ